MAGRSIPWLYELKRAEAHAIAGRMADAEAVLREILGTEPDQPDALNALAGLAAGAGRLDVAIALQQLAVAARPDAPLYHTNLGEMFRRAGKYAPAIEHSGKAVALRPSFAAAHNNLGVAHADAGDVVAALKCYDAALAQKPEFAEAHNNRGNALRLLGRLEEAEAALRRGIALRPDYPEAHCNLGHVLRDLGRPGEAEAAYRRSLAIRPAHFAALISLSLAMREQGRPGEANVAAEAAMAAAQRVLEIDAGNAEAAHVLGLAYAAVGREDDAVEAFRRATAKPGYVEAWSDLGNTLRGVGRFDEALAAFHRAHELAPRAGTPLLGVAQLKTFRDAADPHLAAMRTLAVDLASLPPNQRLHLHFALAKAYDDLDRPEEAVAHLHAGNAIKRQSVGYDEAKTLRLFERIRSTFDADFMAAQRTGFADDTPIFVIGMPRSGTTLVEQIISSHADVGAAGEIAAMNDVARVLGPFPDAARGLDDLSGLGQEYVRRLRARAPDAAHVTDKTPSSMYFVGLIHLALPDAKIVHVTRDPVDTCLSCYSRLFSHEQGHTYDLAELGRYYRAYHDLMWHWHDVLPEGRMLTVRYERIVADTESEARRMLAHCGLAWDERVLAFYQNRRAVNTASASQVRRPIYSTSVARWRRYEAHLHPLLTALGDLAEHECDSGARP